MRHFEIIGVSGEISQRRVLRKLDIKEDISNQISQNQHSQEPASRSAAIP